MFQSMLTSRLISADVCGTVMDSLSLQMAQVPPCALSRAPRFALSAQRPNPDTLRDAIPAFSGIIRLHAQVRHAGTYWSRKELPAVCAWGTAQPRQ
jgi:hypothetical protein